MAFADGRLFVPVVDLCGWGSAVARQELDSVDPTAGRARLVALDAASGRTLWERRLPSPSFGCATVANDVVLTSTYDGAVHAFAAADGRVLWRYAAARADELASRRRRRSAPRRGRGRRPGDAGSVTELIAFGLR